MAILIISKGRLQSRDKEKHFIIVKSLIHEGITILNMYTSNNKVRKSKKQKLTKIKGEINRPTIKESSALAGGAQMVTASSWYANSAGSIPGMDT